ncbi:MAG: hypothetical protein PHF14_03840 [Verrucomicrobiota bacterium]|nr:hypothetical protein [Verrucomicrobiota bacterium]
MWDRSYYWMRLLRAGTGLALLLCLVLGVVRFCFSAFAERAVVGLREAGRELRPDATDHFECLVPRSLGVRIGTLVYADRVDGESLIVGRVVGLERIEPLADRIEVLLTPASAGAVRGGGRLLGAGPTEHLDQAMRLLVAPEIPRDEAVLAHRMIWPAIVEHVFPRVSRRLESDLADIALVIAREDGPLIEATFEQLQQRLIPYEEALVRRVAQRVWAEIGIWGTLQGIGRLTVDSSERALSGVRDLVVDIFSEPAPDSGVSHPNRGFFSPERERLLRDALTTEVHAFWVEHQAEVLEAVQDVLQRNESRLAEAVHERWTPQLYDRLLIPGWLEAEAYMIQAMEEYAIDFTNRRLLTRRGGPRLMLAYALRSALEIAPDPLLALALDQGGETGSGEVVFDWLMPVLESDPIEHWRP